MRLPATDDHVPGFLNDLGLPGLVDVHVHSMPAAVQAKVWAAFDALDDPPWPITYRHDEDRRLAILRDLGVVRHTTLAYAHKPGMARWLNDHTLALGVHEQVVPTFTFFPEPSADADVATAIAAGARCVKIHLQVGKFAPTDPLLDDAWAQVQAADIPVVLHAAAVYGGAGGEEWCGVEPVVALLERFPDLRLIIAHLGLPDIADFIALAEQAPRVALDTAMVLTDPPYMGDVPPALLPRLEALAGRVLFGSDFPTIPHRYAAQVRGVAQLGFGDDWLRELLWHAPRRWLRL